MKTVKQILETVGSQFLSVAPKAYMLEALQKLEEYKLDALPVMEGERLVGMFTASDYIHEVALRESMQSMCVEDVMSRQVVTACLDWSGEECIEAMVHHNFNVLPVVDGQRVVGIITMSDAVKATIFHQRETIQFLEDMFLVDAEMA